MIAPNLLRGENVRLTAATSNDMPVITRWWGDPDFLRLYNAAPAIPLNEDQPSRRFEPSLTNPDTILYGLLRPEWLRNNPP